MCGSGQERLSAAALPAAGPATAGLTGGAIPCHCACMHCGCCCCCCCSSCWYCINNSCCCCCWHKSATPRSDCTAGMGAGSTAACCMEPLQQYALSSTIPAAQQPSGLAHACLANPALLLWLWFVMPSCTAGGAWGVCAASAEPRHAVRPTAALSAPPPSVSAAAAAAERAAARALARRRPPAAGAPCPEVQGLLLLALLLLRLTDADALAAPEACGCCSRRGGAGIRDAAMCRAGGTGAAGCCVLQRAPLRPRLTAVAPAAGVWLRVLWVSAAAGGVVRAATPLLRCTAGSCAVTGAAAAAAAASALMPSSDSTALTFAACSCVWQQAAAVIVEYLG